MMTTTPLQATIEELTSLTVWQLADIAGCRQPDKTDLQGIAFLVNVRSDVLERFEYNPDDEDAIFEIADSAPSVYTYEAWQTFIQLAAWVELDDDGEGLGIRDMAASAIHEGQGYRVPMLALFAIAYRLASSLWDDLTTAHTATQEQEN